MSKPYTGGVTVPVSERKWVMYEHGGRWLLTKTGGYGKTHVFSSYDECQEMLRVKEQVNPSHK